METKVCSKCRQLKPLSEYYADKRRRDGKRASCKTCQDMAVNIYKAKNRKLVQERGAKYHASLPKEDLRLKNRNWVKRHRAECTDRLRETRKNNPDKARAWNLINKAVRSGNIKRPDFCERCGTTGRIEASHDDYSKPFDVEWLCVPCHRRKDREKAKGVENVRTIAEVGIRSNTLG